MRALWSRYFTACIGKRSNPFAISGVGSSGHATLPSRPPWLPVSQTSVNLAEGNLHPVNSTPGAGAMSSSMRIALDSQSAKLPLNTPRAAHPNVCTAPTVEFKCFSFPPKEAGRHTSVRSPASVTPPSVPTCHPSMRASSSRERTSRIGASGDASSNSSARKSTGAGRKPAKSSWKSRKTPVVWQNKPIKVAWKANVSTKKGDSAKRRKKRTEGSRLWPRTVEGLRASR